MKRSLKLGRPLAAALVAVLLAGCPLRPPQPALPSAAPPAGTGPALPHLGVPYDIVAGESQLLIRVYRGGTLASSGHNHLIAARGLSGSLYVPAELLRSSFEVHIPVAELTVDEGPLRAAEGGTDFAAAVPDTARAGTRRNMLGEALLDAAHSPEIVLRALQLDTAPGAAAPASTAGTVVARIEATVRGQTHVISVPVSYRIEAGAVIASGETALRQTELGLTPFSALLGALQVLDEMRVSFRIVARTAGAPPGTAR